MPADGNHSAATVASFDPFLHLLEVHPIQVFLVPQLQPTQLPAVNRRVGASHIANIRAVKIPLPVNAVGQAIFMAE